MSARTRNFRYHLRRSALLAAICAAHALLFWTFRINPDPSSVVEVRLLQTTNIEEHKPDDPPPHLPMAAAFERPPFKIPVPEIVVAPPTDAPSSIDAEPTGHAASFAPPPSEAAVDIPSSALKFIYAPSSQDYYPEVSSQFGEHGLTLLNVCVNALNKIDRVEVIQSSGFKRLDAAALALTSKSRWKAATENGKPVPACARFFVNFVAGKSVRR